MNAELTSKINVLLKDLGIGAVEKQLESLPGRHENWAVITEDGRQVFIKSVPSTTNGGGQMSRRLIAFHRISDALDERFHSPQCIGWSKEYDLFVYELIQPAISAAQLASDNLFSEDQSYSIGVCIALLHALPAREINFLDEEPQ